MRFAQMLMVCTGILTLGCAAPGGPGTEPPMASGPSPAVTVSLGFGDSPVEGFVYLRPQAETNGWRYSVDIDEDGATDHEGILQGEIGFAYRFTTRGVHRIRFSLAGPQSNEMVDVPVVVNDPDAVQVLVQRAIAGDPDAIFEGITTNRAGTMLFVGDFWNSEIHPLDPADLHALAPPLPLGISGAEGLSVTPSDSILLVGHKRHRLSVVAIPDMEIRRNVRMEGEFFIHALDDATALSPGLTGLDLVDIDTGQTIRRLALPRAWHLAVSPVSPVAAVLNRANPAAVHLASLPDLQEMGHIDLPDVLDAENVAFDPAGDRLYVMGQDQQGSRFLLLDVASRSVLLSLPLGPGACWIFCVANPVAVSRSGRFVAMEHGNGTYFIDTELDLPRFRSSAGLSVAASPTEEAFYVLRPEGLVSKVAIRP